MQVNPRVLLGKCFNNIGQQVAGDGGYDGHADMTTAALRGGAQVIDSGVKVTHQSLGDGNKVLTLGSSANLTGSALQQLEANKFL